MHSLQLGAETPSPGFPDDPPLYSGLVRTPVSTSAVVGEGDGVRALLWLLLVGCASWSPAWMEPGG